MQRFLTGFVIGIAVMYWYAYQKDAFVEQVTEWFASVSADRNASVSVDGVTSRRR